MNYDKDTLIDRLWKQSHPAVPYPTGEKMLGRLTRALRLLEDRGVSLRSVQKIIDSDWPTITILGRIRRAKCAADYDIPRLVEGKFMLVTCINHEGAARLEELMRQRWNDLLENNVPPRKRAAKEPVAFLGIGGDEKEELSAQIRKAAIALRPDVVKNAPGSVTGRASFYTEVGDRAGVSKALVYAAVRSTPYGSIGRPSVSGCQKILKALGEMKREFKTPTRHPQAITEAQLRMIRA